jgi:transposase
MPDTVTRLLDLGGRFEEHRRARDLATQLQRLTGQQIAIREGKAAITDTAA